MRPPGSDMLVLLLFVACGQVLTRGSLRRQHANVARRLVAKDNSPGRVLPRIHLRKPVYAKRMS
jgi:hypothetical protein